MCNGYSYFCVVDLAVGPVGMGSGYWHGVGALSNAGGGGQMKEQSLLIYVVGICHGLCFGLLLGEALALLEWCK
jgi:hypothetical protein